MDQIADFNEQDRDVIYRVIEARRDIRHFLPNQSVPKVVLERILHAAHNAPSVGLMQPWRFIRISDRDLRSKLRAEAEKERLKTADRLGARKEQFLKLKIEGIQDCAELLAMVIAPDDGTIVGRNTMPQEMAISSCACAIQNMWLAARVENIGLGWVSFYDQQKVAKLLKCPDNAYPLAILCLGPVLEFPPAPLMSITGWRDQKSFESVYYQNSYGEEPTKPVDC
ncbi:MAG: 5,6-dimethylbenzimidazole synthase [Magnetococcales bacterium]|nr:5,6-dimethylbenzimidazole synthase [Magnetococcales bacterium]